MKRTLAFTLAVILSLVAAFTTISAQAGFTGLSSEPAQLATPAGPVVPVATEAYAETRSMLISFMPTTAPIATRLWRKWSIPWKRNGATSWKCVY